MKIYNLTHKIASLILHCMAACIVFMTTCVFLTMALSVYACYLLTFPVVFFMSLATCKDVEDFKSTLKSVYVRIPIEILCDSFL